MEKNEKSQIFFENGIYKMDDGSLESPVKTGWCRPEEIIFASGKTASQVVVLEATKTYGPLPRK